PRLGAQSQVGGGVMGANRFLPGNTYGQGRPKGSRNKLQAAFLDDLLKVYGEGGIEALRITMKEKPVEFVKVIASLMPKELEVQTSQLNELTDEQLDAIDALLRQALCDKAERENGTPTSLN